MRVEPYMIESKSEADAYLTAVLANPDYRTKAELEARADKYISDPELRHYFLNKASETLRSTAEPSS